MSQSNAMTKSGTPMLDALAPDQAPSDEVRRAAPIAAWARSVLVQACYVLGTLVIVIGIWQLVDAVFGISQLILPTPGEVLRALNDGSGVVPSNLAQTLYATIVGFAIGLVAGVAVAVLVTEVRLLERTLYPLTVGFQSMPLIGLAPLMIIWFGFGIEAHAAMASIVVFFPIFTNMVHGLEQVDAEGIMLFKSLRASRWQTFVKLKFPSALPYLFAGTDVGIVFAMLGVIVAEFLGANQGMGFLLVQYSNDLDTAGVFEILIILAVVGLILHSVARAIGKMALHSR